MKRRWIGALLLAGALAGRALACGCGCSMGTCGHAGSCDGSTCGTVPAVRTLDWDEPAHPDRAVITAKPVAPAEYVCPMDQFLSDKPGKCPQCGMDLQKVSTANPQN